MKRRKLVLEWNEDSNETKLLGIVSSLSHLEFVHSLNKTGNFNLVRADDLEIETTIEPDYFILFTFEDSALEHTYTLIKAKGSDGLIAKELRGIDYILIINAETDEHSITLYDSLKGLPFVEAIMEIDIHRLSQKTKKILLR